MAIKKGGLRMGKMNALGMGANQAPTMPSATGLGGGMKKGGLAKKKEKHKEEKKKDHKKEKPKAKKKK